MSKLGDKFKDGRIVGIALLGAVVLAGGGLGIATLASANAAPAAVVQTVEPVDFAALPYTNGLAGEQEVDAAAAVAAEQARVAAEAAAAETARVAAEQAAAVEAERVAAEQAAPEQSSDDPAPSGGNSGEALPFTPSSDPNNAQGGTYADPSSFCSSGSASTVNGVPTCD